MLSSEVYGIPTRCPLDRAYVCLFVCMCFMFHSRIYHSYGDVPKSMSREGSLSCHSCCVTGPRCLRSHQKDRPGFVTFQVKRGVYLGH